MHAGRGRIIHVDNEPDITQIVSEGLQHYGYIIDSFNEAIEALAAIKEGKYDLLITCIRMPDLNGFEFIREVKKIDSNVPVIILTAFEFYPEEWKRIDLSSKHNVRHYLVKPIATSDLVEIISNTIIEERKDIANDRVGSEISSSATSWRCSGYDRAVELMEVKLKKKRLKLLLQFKYFSERKKRLCRLKNVAGLD